MRATTFPPTFPPIVPLAAASPATPPAPPPVLVIGLDTASMDTASVSSVSDTSFTACEGGNGLEILRHLPYRRRGLEGGGGKEGRR